MPYSGRSTIEQLSAAEREKHKSAQERVFTPSERGKAVPKK